MMRRLSLSSRIFVGFLVMAVAFSLSGVVAVRALQGARKDLVVLTRGYLALGRTATQLRTTQEIYDDSLSRAVVEPDRLRRAELASFARELYPQMMGHSLDELQVLARQLQRGAERSDAVFLETVFAQAKRARSLALAYDESTTALLDLLDDEDGLDDAGMPLDKDAAVETWRKRSEQASRELRTIALGVDARAAFALTRVEKAEVSSARAVVIALATALVIAGLILWMMLRALAPLRTLALATRALQRDGRTAIEAIVPIKTSDSELSLLSEELIALARALDERSTILSQRTDELVRLSAFAENVIRSVRTGIVVVAGDGAIRSINPAARAVFSLPLRDVEGQSLDSVGDAFGEVVGVVDDVRQSGTMRALSGLRLGDKVVDATVVPLRDRQGEHGGDVLVLGDDVTAREDAREQLVQSERLAAVGRLAAQITHEIRNPLSSIGLNIELLSDDVPSLPDERRAEVQSILDAVLGEVRRLAEITEGYLRFARLPAHAHQAKDLGDLCADLVTFSQSEASAQRKNLELNVDDALPPVTVDASRLRQALLNLVKNAIEAASPGGTVRVSVRRGDDNNVAVTVEDNGKGVPKAQRDQIFSPFFTTKQDGTGLGLVVAREIAREHGGDLDVSDSTLGGAAFTLTLPAQRS